MSPAGVAMESFFNRIIGRWSDKDRKRRTSLQESSRTETRMNGSEGGRQDPATSPNVTEQPEVERCADWSRDDDGSEEVMVTSMDNQRDTRGMNVVKKKQSSDRKASFSLFGGRLVRKNKDSQPDEEMTGVLRRPKRFFSQQNLRAVSTDSPIIDSPVSTPRIGTPKFLWRLVSHQSNQDLSSVHEGVRDHDQGRSSSSRPYSAIGTVSSSNAKTRATTLGKSPVSDVRLGPEGMEGDDCWVTEASSRDVGSKDAEEAVKRDGSVHAPVSCPSWSTWQAEDQTHVPSQVNRVRHNAVIGHDLSVSGRILGEYRPQLNTHPEEPTGVASVEDVPTRAAGFCSTNRWSLQVPETVRDPTSLHEILTEQRHAFEGSRKEQMCAAAAKTQFASVSALDKSRDENPDQRSTSNLDRLVDEPDLQHYQRRAAVNLGSMELCRKQVSSSPILPPSHFKSASYDSGVSDHQRNTDVRRLHEENSPSQFSPKQVQTLRQRSQEIYGNYSLGGRRTVSYADIFYSVGDQKQHKPGTDYRPTVVGLKAGLSGAPDMNSPPWIADSFRTGVGRPQHTSGADPFHPSPGHTRSLSMSHLQSNTGDLLQWNGRQPNGFNQSPSNAPDKVFANSVTGRVWFPGNVDDARYFKQIPPHHKKGGSLDFSEVDRSAFDPTLLPSYAGTRRSTLVEDQVFSDPEVVGNFKRRNYDQTDRPLRYLLSNRQGSGSHGHDTNAKRVQQQAVLNLFQRLTLAKQQKMYDSCGSNMRNRESLLPSEIPEPGSTEQSETRGWDGGIREARSSLSQTLTDPNSRVSAGPESMLLSTIRAIQQSSTDSYEDLNSEDGLMEPLRIDEPITHAPRCRLEFSKRSGNNDQLSLNSSSTNLTNHRDASVVESRTKFTANHPAVFHLACQSLKETEQNDSPSPPSPLPPSSPPPSLSSPTSRRLQSYSLNSDGSCTGIGLGFDANDPYASHLRQEARKLSVSRSSLRKGSVSKRENLVEDSEVSRDLGRCDAGSFPGSLQQQQVKQEDGDRSDEPVPCYRLAEGASNTRSTKNPELSELDHSSCDQFLTKADSYATGINQTQVSYCDAQNISARNVHSGREIIQSESERIKNENGRVYGESGRGHNGNGRVQSESRCVQSVNGRVQSVNGRFQSVSGRAQREEDRFQSEPIEKASSHLNLSISTNDAYCNRTRTTSQQILPSTGDVARSAGHTSASGAVASAAIRIPDTPRGLQSRRNSSLSTSTTSSELVHNLKDFPDVDSSGSTEDDSFRVLSSVLCRHMVAADEELCSALRPPYVKASADLVRWIFESRNLLDLDLTGRLDQRCRTSKTSKETPKDLKTPHSSLQTLKDELLVLVEKRQQGLQDRKQRISERLTETLLLQKEVTAIVRQKTDRKQFEKFLSYLEQLEKVVQLLLNLSVRLSNVESDLCDLSKEDDASLKQKKQLSDKRHQILERIKEAMELKRGIDSRSEQVSACLSNCLTPVEFGDFREMVRSRCHLMLQRQAIDDQVALAQMQEKVLMMRCQDQQRQNISSRNDQNIAEYDPDSVKCDQKS